MRLKVIIPSYNCPQWIGRALASVANQTYKNYDVLVIDDASPELIQRDIIRSTCDALGWDFICNTNNMRAGYNLFRGIHHMNPDFDDVIFILDGDDFLPHSDVFSMIDAIYRNPDVWFSYGQYKPYPYDTGQTPASPYSPEQIRDSHLGSIRQIPSLINHPISFRYFLFDQLTEADMKTDDGGRWFRAGYDRVMFVPMMEMAGEHYHFEESILYMYNSVNPISDSTASLPEVHEAHRAVLARPPRQKIDPGWVAAQRSNLNV